MIDDQCPPIDQLSLDAAKLHAYLSDIEFLQGFEFFRRFYNERWIERAFDHTFLIIQPESLIGGYLEEIWKRVQRAGFEVLDWRPLRLDLRSAFSIWRYQWNAATYSRRLFVSLKNTTFESIVLLLRRPWRCHETPASLALFEIKGSSRFRERITDTQLRGILPFANRAMTYIHCPDEPADVIRELACLREVWDIGEVLALLDRSPEPSECQSLLSNALKFANGFSDLSKSQPEFMPLEAFWERYCDPRSSSAALRAFQARTPANQWAILTEIADILPYDRPNQQPLITTRMMPETAMAWRQVKSKVGKSSDFAHIIAS